MDISTDNRSRILEAADRLFEEADRERFPTVDQVRRAARVDMNAASMVMKEWRRQQTAAPTTVGVEIPVAVHEAFHGALLVAWQKAQDTANESLHAAQQAWETERSEAEELRREMADAYEDQAKISDNLQKELDDARSEGATAESQKQTLSQELDTMDALLKDAKAKLVASERREQDRSERIEELREELLKEKAANESIREKLEQSSESYLDKLADLQKRSDATAQELATIKARFEAQQETMLERQKAANDQVSTLTSDLHNAKKEASEARERLAGVLGQLDELNKQNKELMEVIQKGLPQKKTVAPRKRVAKPKDGEDTKR